MHVALGGVHPDHPNDPFQIVASVIDEPLLQGPLDKDLREDLQIWSALQVLALKGICRHPLAVRPGDDPPDRYIEHIGRVWGTELTELTFEHVRAGLSPVRAVARELQRRLRTRAAGFPHLAGRIVTMMAMPDRPMPRNHRDLLDSLEQALEEDRGVPGAVVDPDTGQPVGMDGNGLYGEHGPFVIVVNLGGLGAEIVVSAAPAAHLRRSEVLDALGKTIAAKDHAGNDVLIVTCGLPDSQGYTCAADTYIFNALLGAHAGGIDVLPVKPAHIKGLVVHDFAGGGLIVWGTAQLPWITAVAAR